MASLVTWSLYNDAGVPLTGATIGSSGIHFVDYCDRNGTGRAQPTIQEFGGGVYGFTSGPDDDRVGTLYLIANGTANPARYSGRVTTDAQPFAAWHLEDNAGALWTGAAPTIGSYTSPQGSRTPPTLVAVRTYLFAVTPTAADLAVGATMRADSPAGANPSYFQQTLLSQTVFGSFAAGSVVISSTQVRSVDSNAWFQVSDTVTAATNIGAAVFVYRVDTSAFDHVATAGDMQAHPDTRAAAVTAGDAYYRQANVTTSFQALADAVSFAAILNLRLKQLCTEQNLFLNGFLGTTSATVTS